MPRMTNGIKNPEENLLDRGRPKATLNKSSQGIAVAAFVVKGVVKHCENDKSWIAVRYLSRKMIPKPEFQIPEYRMITPENSTKRLFP